MKHFSVLLAFAWVFLLHGPLSGQKQIPYSFDYQADPSEEAVLEPITVIDQAGTSFLRLYFEEVDLGKNSYLLLEGTDGATQKLTAETIQYWNNSSAYFNGGKVKVSVFVAAQEAPTFKIHSLKIGAAPSRATDNTHFEAQSLGRIRINGETPRNNADNPFGKAVGRFTNGSQSNGSGWIAPNGAIVTSKDIYQKWVQKGYDIIEFNVPNSSKTGSVNHPAPEDQYPLKSALEDVALGSKQIKLKNDGGVSFAGWTVLEAMPNSTGLRPGERQQAYFRVAINPGNKTIKDQGSIPIDVLHYGDWYPEITLGLYKTLHTWPSILIGQNRHISVLQEGDRDDFVLYNMISYGGSDVGGPIAYRGTNVAIGVHNQSWSGVPSYGLGFRSAGFRGGLNNFFTSKVRYVDANGAFSGSNGLVYSPHPSVQQAVNDTQENGTIFIAKGEYPGTLYANKAMTLRAPVGAVRLGTGTAIMEAQTTLPDELLNIAESLEETLPENQESMKMELGLAPNPFNDQLSISFQLEKKTETQVSVIDLQGRVLKNLSSGLIEAGFHRLSWDGTNNAGAEVPPGVYFIQIRKEEQIETWKVVKK